MQRALQMRSPFTKLDDAKRFLAMVAVAKDPAQTREAAAQVQQVLSADSNYLPALMASTIMQEQRTSYDEAKGGYERILAAYPLFTPAVRQLAILSAQHFGDDQKTYQLAVRAREAFPEDSEIAKTLGILACRRGDSPRAAQLLKESARTRNDDPELLYYLGIAHYRLKETKESKAALQRALALNLQTKLANEARRVLAELK